MPFVPTQNASQPLLVVACLALLGACSGPVASDLQAPSGPPASTPPTPEPEAETAAQLEGTHVVVRSGALFYPSAYAEQPVLTRSFLPDDEAPQGSLEAKQVGWVMALGGQTDTRVEVLSLTQDEPEGSCGRQFGGLEELQLHMWVERDALLEVTTTLAKLRYADGSGLDIPPGIPILPSSPISAELSEEAAQEPGPWISAWGFARSLAQGEFSDDAPLRTGLSFVPLQRPPLTGEASVSETMLLGGREYWSWSAKQGVRIEEGERHFVVLRETCLDVRALEVDEIPEGAEGPGWFGSFGSGGGYSPMDQRRLLAAPAGATLYWPDGSVAGETRAELRANRVQAPGEGYCAYYGVGDGTRDLVLCLSPDEAKVLQLGYVRAENPKWKTKLDDESGAQRRLDGLMKTLLVPCVSRAIELDPTFDLRVRVRLDVDKPSKEAGTGPEWTQVKFEGKPKGLSPELRQCMQTQLGKWRPSAFVGNEVRVDVRMSAAKPAP